jgi:hypothetical protein
MALSSIDLVASAATITSIGRAFDGPARSAHGGYACAVFARASGLAPPVAVTLLAAPPLETEMTVTVVGARAFVGAGDTLVASVAQVSRAPTAVPPVDLLTARVAARGFQGRTEHPFPTCFVCGPDRVDGLRLAPGPVAGRPDTVACPWTPNSDDPDIVWSVLDCPGGWVERRPVPLVLTRLSVTILGRVKPGAAHVVVAARRGGHGRTVSVGSSLYTATRQLIATAAAVWTAIPDGLRRTG